MRAAVAILPLLGPAACARPMPATLPQPREATYARTPGDTLRYRKHSEWFTSFGLAGMPDAGRTRYKRDARFAITFGADGTARGWFEAMRLESRQGRGSREIQQAGPDVIGAPFALAVGALGIDSVFSAPQLPPNWSAPEGEFNGIFPRLPGGALTPAKEWTNNGSGTRVDSIFVTSHTRAISYRVVGTSTMHGVPVVVVQYEAVFEAESRSRQLAANPALDPYLFPPYQDNSRTVEHGTFYFTPATGRLIRHEWTGERDFTKPSGNLEAAIQHTEYRATLELVSSPRR